MRKPKSSPKLRKKPMPNVQSRQGSAYDKVIKENFEKSLKTIIQDIGGVPIVK